MTDHQWGEVLYFQDGVCFGIAPDGRTIHLGKEADVRAMLADPAKRSLDPVINDIIDLERKLKKEESEKNGRGIELQRPGAFRNRAAGKAKRGAAHPKSASFRKRLPGGAFKR